MIKRLFKYILLISIFAEIKAQKPKPFKAIAFYTAKNDQAHISFVHEANRWFPEMAMKHNFTYDSTDNWANLNDEFLAKYQLVIFLDTRPEDANQRKAFQMAELGWVFILQVLHSITPSLTKIGTGITTIFSAQVSIKAILGDPNRPF